MLDLMLDFLSHVGDIGVCSELSGDEFLSRTIRLIRWPLQRSPSPLRSCRDRGRTGSTLVPQENDATPELAMETFQLLSLIAVITVAGCATEPNKGNAQFIVKVDSMTHPSFAVTADTITIRLFGTIGPDGCHLFSHFEERRQPLRLDLTVWGQVSSATVCPAMMVYLNGMEHKLVATQQGWLSINIHQPDGGILTDSIIVK
jgi:hypothetical protein